MSFKPIQDKLEGHSSRTMGRFHGVHTGRSDVDADERFANTCDVDCTEKTLKLRPGLSKLAATGETSSIRMVAEINLMGERFVGMVRNGALKMVHVGDYLTCFLAVLFLAGSVEATTLYVHPTNYPFNIDRLNTNLANLNIDGTYATNWIYTNTLAASITGTVTTATNTLWNAVTNADTNVVIGVTGTAYNVMILTNNADWNVTTNLMTNVVDGITNGYFRADGTIPMSGDLDLNGNDVIDIRSLYGYNNYLEWIANTKGVGTIFAWVNAYTNVLSWNWGIVEPYDRLVLSNDVLYINYSPLFIHGTNLMAEIAKTNQLAPLSVTNTLWQSITNNDTNVFIAATNWVDGAYTRTNDSRQLSLLGNIEIANATQTNNPVTWQQLLDSLEGLESLTWYGATNAQAQFSTAGRLQDSPPSAIVITNALSAGTFTTNYFWYTNFTTRLRSGLYVVNPWCKATGAGTMYISVALISSTNYGATTNILDTSASNLVSAALDDYRLTVHNSNDITGTGAVWFGMASYNARVGGDASAGAIEMYIGDPYDTHLSGPNLGDYDLGARGATGAVYAAGTAATYDSATRILTLGTNDFGGGGGSASTNGLLGTATYIAGTGTVYTATTNLIPYSYINGMWCEYVDTNTVSWKVSATNVGGGEGYCADKRFTISSTISSDVTSLTAPSTTASVHYAYINYAALPTVTIYWSTNPPVWVTTYQQWGDSATNNNRMIDAILSTNSSSIIPAFLRQNDGRYDLSGGNTISLLASGNPNGAYQATTTPAAGYLPVSATKVGIYLKAEDADAAGRAYVRATDGANAALGQFAHGWYSEIAFREVRFVEITLGPSRNISWFGDDNDDSVFGIILYRWEMSR